MITVGKLKWDWVFYTISVESRELSLGKFSPLNRELLARILSKFFIQCFILLYRVLHQIIGHRELHEMLCKHRNAQWSIGLSRSVIKILIKITMKNFTEKLNILVKISQNINLSLNVCTIKTIFEILKFKARTKLVLASLFTDVNNTL